MHIIIGIPPHIIMHGMPAAIIAIMALQRSRIMSICELSMGTSLQVMPSLVISQDIRHIIGIMLAIGIGIAIGMGIGMDIAGDPIIGMAGIPIGLIPIIPMGMGIMLFIGIGIMAVFMVGLLRELLCR
jgi:hypothetical protein